MDTNIDAVYDSRVRRFWRVTNVFDALETKRWKACFGWDFTVPLAICNFYLLIVSGLALILENPPAVVRKIIEMLLLGEVVFVLVTLHHVVMAALLFHALILIANCRASMLSTLLSILTALPTLGAIIRLSVSIFEVFLSMFAAPKNLFITNILLQLQGLRYFCVRWSQRFGKWFHSFWCYWWSCLRLLLCWHILVVLFF